MFLNKKNLYLVIKIIFISFLIFFPIRASEVRIIDGDTIHLNKDKIRFSGIDAPELNQTCISNNQEVKCGIISKELLTKKIANKKPFCIREGVDQYRRILAECFIDNESLSSFLVRNGYAFAYRRYSEKYIKDEDYAKENLNGMWSMIFEFPWDFRRK